MKNKIIIFITILTFSFPVTSFAKKRVVIFVNGHGDCCAWGMDKVLKNIISHNMDFIQTSWVHFTHGSKSKFLEPTGYRTNNFVNEGMRYFNSLPKGSDVFLIGHSFGADSLLNLVRSYQKSRINIRLLALIDPVSTGGIRVNLSEYSVGKNVEYFYNRWQDNYAWPLDFKVDGNIRCYAEKCDQKKRSFLRSSNGNTKTRTCGWHEFGCSGRSEIKGKPGYVKRRSSHQDLAYDDLIASEINKIIDYQRVVSATETITYRPIWMCNMSKGTVYYSINGDNTSIPPSGSNRCYKWMLDGSSAQLQFDSTINDNTYTSVKKTLNFKKSISYYFKSIGDTNRVKLIAEPK